MLLLDSRKKKGYFEIDENDIKNLNLELYTDNHPHVLALFVKAPDNSHYKINLIEINNSIKSDVFYIDDFKIASTKEPAISPSDLNYKIKNMVKKSESYRDTHGVLPAAVGVSNYEGTKQLSIERIALLSALKYQEMRHQMSTVLN